MFGFFENLGIYINVAQHTLANAGGGSLSKETVTRTATNQFTNKLSDVQLPKLLVGNQWLDQNIDPAGACGQREKWTTARRFSFHCRIPF